MAITKEDVKHVAKLSALRITDEEIPKKVDELSAILNYVEALNKVNTRGVEPTLHVHGVVNFFREDVVTQSLPQEALEINSPNFENGYFRVPKVI